MIPEIHAEASAKRYGGVKEDYIDIHRLMDSTKAAVGNNSHRIFTHNSWFVCTIIPMIFGERRKNSDDKWYNCKDVAEYHLIEDFRGFIPTPQDYLEHFECPLWVNNGMDKPNRLKRKSEDSINLENKLID